MAISLSHFVIGAPFEDSGSSAVNGLQTDETRVDSGAAYDFVVSTHPPAVVFCTGDGHGQACPCGNNGAILSGCANSSFAGGARLEATGVASFTSTSAALVLTASNVTGTVLFARGTPSNGWSGVVFGDGLLCVSGGVALLGVVQHTAGTASIPCAAAPTPLHVAGLASGVGTAWSCQAIYRDSAPFCTPGVSNTTSALLVTWGN